MCDVHLASEAARDYQPRLPTTDAACRPTRSRRSPCSPRRRPSATTSFSQRFGDTRRLETALRPACSSRCPSSLVSRCFCLHTHTLAPAPTRARKHNRPLSRLSSWPSSSPSATAGGLSPRCCTACSSCGLRWLLRLLRVTTICLSHRFIRSNCSRSVCFRIVRSKSKLYARGWLGGRQTLQLAGLAGNNKR